MLLVDGRENAGLPPEEILRKLRNVVLEMTAEPEAIKPIRPPDRALQRTPALEIAFTDRPGRVSVAA